MPRAVLDPGVLVSALLSPRGVPARLLMMCFGGHFELIVSPALLRELEGVLLRAKFRKRVTKDQAREFVARLSELATRVPDPRVREPGLTPDPKDDYLVALAHASGASCLVSGDAHLVELDDLDPPVMTPRAFFDMLEKQEP